MRTVQVWTAVIILFMLALPGGQARAQSSGTPFPGNADRDDLALRVDALTRQVAELTRTIEILMQRTSGLAGGPASGAEKPQPTAISTPGTTTAAQSASNLPSSTAASGSSQSTPVASESAVRALGPFRFGGDFRLRLDGIIRPAYNSTIPGQASLPHVQNVRGRYRLRLNLDTDILPAISFHGQLATGPVNNPLTLDQDFAGIVTRHPVMINEAWVDFHLGKWLTIQGGKLQEVFADNLRFLFDDDITFNGFNQRFAFDFKKSIAGIRRLEVRAGQYVFTNPNVAVVNAGNIGAAGAIVGSTGRSAQLFHQGILLEQGLSPRLSQVYGVDLQLYRNPNQIQFASTTAGLPVLVQNALGVALAGPLPGTGNATTTPGGAIYTAHNFQVARLTYRLDYTGLKSGRQEYPIAMNFQAARNVGTGQRERDALLASIKVGRIKTRWDHSFMYLFALKGANSMISQLSDDDLGTLTGVNIRAHYLRFDIGLAKSVQLQNLFFIQNELSNSGQFPNFFVPFGSYAPRQYRFQEQLLFVF